MFVMKRTYRRKRWVVGLAAMTLLSSCAPVGTPLPPQPAPAAPAKIMIFGGDGHKTYLGCLNCSQYATDSVHNQYGEHGSPYASESIFNHYGQYGSPYSTESACNPYATDPPVIVDGNGNYHGRLTLNRYHPELGAGTSYIGWLAAVCRS
jgi:hypothetical protein